MKYISYGGMRVEVVGRWYIDGLLNEGQNELEYIETEGDYIIYWRPTVGYIACWLYDTGGSF